MGQELGTIEYAAIIAGSIAGIMRDPLSWVVVAACLGASIAGRGWWWPFIVATAWVGFVVLRLYDYWVKLGEDPLQLAVWQWFLWMIIALAAGLSGRLLRRLKKPIAQP